MFYGCIRRSVFFFVLDGDIVCGKFRVLMDGSDFVDFWLFFEEEVGGRILWFILFWFLIFFLEEVGGCCRFFIVGRIERIICKICFEFDFLFCNLFDLGLDIFWLLIIVRMFVCFLLIFLFILFSILFFFDLIFIIDLEIWFFIDIFIGLLL